MAAPIPIQPWYWAGFVIFILLAVAVDLGVFHRGARTMKTREALLWSGVWFLAALIFGSALSHWRGREASFQFLGGYLVELSLSLDNLLAIAVIFTSFRLEEKYQHWVLGWGIVGALVMRGVMIGAGAVLLQAFHWLLYLMGLFLVVTGARWAFSKQSPASGQKHRIAEFARKVFPITPNFEGGKFIMRSGGKFALTPLALVLIAVEAADIIFAVDSVPAVFAVTQDAFIVFTSNMFAVLGLRSLYFVLTGALSSFRYLRAGLAAVLILIGVKMLASDWIHWPTVVWMGLVALIVATAILYSVLDARRNKGQNSAS